MTGFNALLRDDKQLIILSLVRFLKQRSVYLNECYIKMEPELIRIYGVPTCDKIKKTQKLLDSRNIDYTFINVRKTPIEKDKLIKITDKLGIDKVLNSKGMLYRKLGLKDKNLSAEQLLEELYNEQGMIKRPLIEKNDRYSVGYDEAAILNFLEN